MLSTQGLIIPILPFVIEGYASVHEDTVQQWIGILLGAYGAGVLIGSPIAGYFADNSASRRIPYLVGLIALAASTVAFSIARSTTVLLIGRLVQGASTASVNSVGFAILADTVGDGKMGPVMGVVDISMAVGSIFGPVCGGFLYHQFGYSAVFESAYVLIALDFSLRLLMVEKNGKAKGSRQGDERASQSRSDNFEEEARSRNQDAGFDQREITRVGSLAGDYGSISRGTSDTSISPIPPDQHSTPSSENNLSPTESLLSKPQPSRRHPILVLLSTPRMCAALLGDFMQSVVLTGLESILPLRIKSIFHYNSKNVALIFFILSIPCFAAPAIGHLSDKVGARIVVSIGFVTLSPLLILLRMVDHYDTAQVVLLCVLLLLIGAALNLILTPVFSDVIYLVDEKEAANAGIFGPKGAYAQAFALMGVAYASGSLVGPLLGGLVVERVGWNGVTLGTGVLSAICVVPSLCALGGRPRK